MYQNRLTQQYQSYKGQPVQYMNNNLINNNPSYASNIYDRNFYQQMMMVREEQLKKIHNISDLNMSKEQISEYVIAPIKIEKSKTSEIEKLFNIEEKMLTKNFIENNWWSKRKNIPYKNILKNEDWGKKFDSQEDLIVHKVSDLDKVGLMDDYKKLMKLLEKHDGEIKTIYSASKKNEYKKKFKFVNKYKYRYKYDPKNFDELKNYYKKEQKKHDCEQKRYENIITKIMDENIKTDELKQIESEFFKPPKSTKKNSKNRHNEKEIDKEINKLINKCDDDILMDMLDNSDDDDDNSENSVKITSKSNSINNKKNIINNKKNSSVSQIKRVSYENNDDSSKKDLIEKIKISRNSVDKLHNTYSNTEKPKRIAVLCENPVHKNIKTSNDPKQMITKKIKKIKISRNELLT